MKSIKKREPRLLGEVIRDLIEQGKLLPNYKFWNYDAQF